jgi:hypothetical protein
VEGPNNGGKSTALRLLRQMMPGSTILEIHDTGHVHILRQAALLKSQLVRMRDWRTLPETVTRDCISYLDAREESCVSLLDSMPLDDVVVERLLLTTYVYKRMLFNEDGLGAMRARLECLKAPQTHLVLLTADVDRLIERATASTIEKRRNVTKETPEHLTDRSLVRLKAGLYDIGFEQLGGIGRTRVDTSDLDGDQLAVALSSIVSRVYSDLNGI